MKYLVLIALLFVSGCAELGMVNAKEDCNGRHSERNTTPGYPCECCQQGE